MSNNHWKHIAIDTKVVYFWSRFVGYDKQPRRSLNDTGCDGRCGKTWPMVWWRRRRKYTFWLTNRITSRSSAYLSKEAATTTTKKKSFLFLQLWRRGNGLVKYDLKAQQQQKQNWKHPQFFFACVYRWIYLLANIFIYVLLVLPVVNIFLHYSNVIGIAA